MKKNKKMVNEKGSEDFELVPEIKFHELEKKVEYISKSPFIGTKDIHLMGDKLDGVQESIISLLEVLQLLSNHASFQDTEKNLIQNELAPLQRAVYEIKQQNETLATSIVNIIDRLNDINTKLDLISKKQIPLASKVQNPTLPPLNGGPIPPNTKFPSSNQNFNNVMTSGNGENNSFNNVQNQFNSNQVGSLDNTNLFNSLRDEIIIPKPLDGNAIPPLNDKRFKF